MFVQQRRSNYQIDQVDIWMMKKYGVAESWTKISLITPNKPICLLGDDNVVFIAEEQKFLGDNNAIFVVKQKKLVVHNLTEKTTRHTVVPGIGDHLQHVMGFSESLVSPLYHSQNWRAT